MKNGGLENHNDFDLVQAFLKKWWVESDSNKPFMCRRTVNLQLETNSSPAEVSTQ